MGQSGKRRKKSRGGKSAASTTSSPPLAENHPKVTVDIHMGVIEFLEGSRKLGMSTSPQGQVLDCGFIILAFHALASPTLQGD